MPATDRTASLLASTRASRHRRAPGADVGADAPPPWRAQGAATPVGPLTPPAPPATPITESGPLGQTTGRHHEHGSPPDADAWRRVPTHDRSVRDAAPTELLRVVEPDLPSRRLLKGKDGVLTLPTGLAGARVSPPWAAIIGAALVLLVALGVLVLGLTRDRHTAEPVPTRPMPAGTAPTGTTPGALVDRGVVPTRPTTAPAPAFGGGTPTAPGSAAAAPPAADASPLLVHVVGQVRRPAVVRVPAGARVTDAIAAAGGPTPKAVLAGLNLARPVVDGEQIVVPDRLGAPVPVTTLPPPPSPGAPPTPGATGAGGLVDLNTADQAALEALPGVGPATATKILEWRAKNGRFTTIDELGEIDGIGEKKLEQIRPRVRV